MHSNVTIKDVNWLHFSWATLYMCRRFPNEVSNVYVISLSYTQRGSEWT